MEIGKAADGGEGFTVSIDDLIKVNLMQKAIAEATLKTLYEAKSAQEELTLYRERESKRLEMLYAQQGEENNVK